MIHLTWWQLLLVIGISGSVGAFIISEFIVGAIADENIRRAAEREENYDA